MEENAKRTALSLKAENDELEARVTYISQNVEFILNSAGYGYAPQERQHRGFEQSH